MYSQNKEPEIISIVTVHQEDGYYLGWPANNGVWSWDDGEIVVGFTRGPFALKGLSQAEELQGLEEFTPRTDYIIESGNSASVFLSVKTPRQIIYGTHNRWRYNFSFFRLDC